MPLGPVLDRINALAWVDFLAAAGGWLGANELRWSPVEGAADYAVRVTDTRGQVRFQNTVKGTTIELPPTYSSKQQCLGWKEVGSRTSAAS